MSGRPENTVGISRPIPARAGIGLRAQHHEDLLRDRPAIAWLEAHSENYFADGGAQIDYLDRLRSLYPLSLHGVGLSIGSTDPWNREHLRKLKRLIRWSEPQLVSEHLSWGSAGGVYLNDLLPMPYTEEALGHLVARVGELQDFLGRQVLIENVSSYLQYSGSAMAEWDFIAALAESSGCGLLLDINNIYVSARNHGFDPFRFVSSLPLDCIREIHLAGHCVNRYGEMEILIDTHSTHVCAEVWNLYTHVLTRSGAIPTVIEWDTDIPALKVLVAEAEQADGYLQRASVAPTDAIAISSIGFSPANGPGNSDFVDRYREIAVEKTGACA
jgi:uncharacterized protein (UPF0276 family)